MNQDSKHNRLVDYLVLVGPKKKRTFDVSHAYPTRSYDQCSTAPPVILNRFPSADHPDFELAYDVSYFCQPEGSNSHSEETKTHLFMLTYTETNRKTYGMCLSFPHLFDPPSAVDNSDCTDSLCIQEWGTLSVCLLSRHPFFKFFSRCLTTLSHFVQDFSESEPLWKELLNHKSATINFSHPMSRRRRILNEIVGWIKQLLLLEAPEPGSSLEVELEVDPAVILAYPSAHRLPLFELPVHRMFTILDVCTVIEIFKLVLSEHKVIVHSSDSSFVSECVLTILALLYPVQYLYPLVPLLPTSMPTAENLLMVPTPFFIGVCSSFLRNVHEVHVAEVWLINLDTKEIKPPTFLDQPVLEFPYSILQLQAEVRLAMDKLDVVTPTENHVIGPTVTSTPTILSQTVLKLATGRGTPSQKPPPAEDGYRRHLENEVDVMIRVAFVEFFFNVDILGLIDQHLCIYRLFPRPVVAIRKSAFLSAYERINSAADVGFMRDLMSTQGVEYFFEWSLNPPNSAYEEIRRGVQEVNRVSDKQCHYILKQAYKTKQVCLYQSSPDSLLYREMLTFKATHSSPHTTTGLQLPDDDSDSEYMTGGGEHYDGDSESSYFTEEDKDRESSSSPFQILKGAVVSDKPDDMLDDVEVGYYSTRRVSSPSEDMPTINQSSTQLLPQTGQKLQRPKSMVTAEIEPTPTLDLNRKSLSFGNLSLTDTEHSGVLSHLGNQSTTYLTSTEYLTAHQFDTDTGRASIFSVSTSEEETEDFSPNEGRGFRSNEGHGLRNNEGRGLRNGAHTPSDSSTSPEHRHYTTPGLTLPQQLSSPFGDDGGHGQVSRTILAMSALNNSKTMDNQIVEIVSKVVGGSGISWPKPASLKRLSAYEKTRVLILRHLEERLGVRTSNDVVLATNAQITPVGVSRAVYRGVLDLLKYLLHSVEEDFTKEPESPLFSAFIIFRLAFSVYHEPKTKSTLGFSLRSALSISTSLMATQTPKPLSTGSSSSQVPKPLSPDTSSQVPKPLSPDTSPSQVTANKVLGDTIRDHPNAEKTYTSSELASKQSRFSTIAAQDELLNQLINSPRFYHPREGQDVRSFSFLYKELLKGQGNSRPFVVKKTFWSNVFMSTIDADRGYMGWNERTPDLYNRYNTLPEVHRRTFGSEEDHLLSIIAHNLLVYMLMVGLSSRETMSLINDFTARIRLATFEERLLQQTIRYLEDNTSSEIELSHLSLVALYSEIHPTISHIVHYGINMIAPVYKLQITNEALILRRFPDERISARLWNDRITHIERNEGRATVSVHYCNSYGEFIHHFHTKQYEKVFESLNALVKTQAKYPGPDTS